MKRCGLVPYIGPPLDGSGVAQRKCGLDKEVQTVR